MTSPPPPRSPFPAASDGDFDLGAFAAGEATPAEAEAIRARAVADPGFAREVESARRVEAALAADDLLPPPLGLLSRVRERVRSEADGSSRIAWSAAAIAAVLALFLGLVPAVFDVGPLAAASFSSDVHERLDRVVPGGVASGPVADATDAFADGASALSDATEEMDVKAIPAAAESAPGGPGAVVAAGFALVVLGLALSRRWRRGFEPSRPEIDS